MNDCRFRVDDGTRLILSGELVMSSINQPLVALSSLLDTNREITELDLSGVGKVDSTAVALLLELKRIAVRQGRSLRLIAVPEKLRTIAGISGVDRFFD